MATLVEGESVADVVLKPKLIATGGSAAAISGPVNPNTTHTSSAGSAGSADSTSNSGNSQPSHPTTTAKSSSRRGFVPIRPALRPLLPKPVSMDDTKPSGVQVKSKSNPGPGITIGGRKRRGEITVSATSQTSAILSKRRRSPSQTNRISKPVTTHHHPQMSMTSPDLLSAGSSSMTVSPSVFVDSHLSVSLADLTTNSSDQDSVSSSTLGSPTDSNFDNSYVTESLLSSSHRGAGAVASVVSTMSSLGALASRLTESSKAGDMRSPSVDTIDDFQSSVHSFSPAPSNEELGFSLSPQASVSQPFDIEDSLDITPTPTLTTEAVDDLQMSFKLEMEAERAAAEMSPPSPGGDFDIADSLSLDFSRSNASMASGQPTLDPMEYFGPQVDFF